MSRLVDLSFVVEASPRDLPAFMRIEVEYSDHAQGAAEFEQLLGVDRRLLRDEEGPAGERLSIGTHATTHVDAPWHYNSRIAGAPAATIDELPLDWFYGPGVVVDARAKADGDPVTRSEMEQGIADVGHALAPRDIVLVHTGRDAFIAERDFMWRGPGVTPDATAIRNCPGYSSPCCGIEQGDRTAAVVGDEGVAPGVHEDDVARAQRVARVGDALLHLIAGDRIAVGLRARVDHDARPVEPVEGQLVDRRRRRAGDARVVVPRRVEVGRCVRADRQPFARRALLVTEQAAIDAEQLLELAAPCA